MGVLITRSWRWPRLAAPHSPRLPPAKQTAKAPRSLIIRFWLKHSAWGPAGSSASRAAFQSRLKASASAPLASVVPPQPWTDRSGRPESTHLAKPNALHLAKFEHSAVLRKGRHSRGSGSPGMKNLDSRLHGNDT